MRRVHLQDEKRPDGVSLCGMVRYGGAPVLELPQFIRQCTAEQCTHCTRKAMRLNPSLRSASLPGVLVSESEQSHRSESDMRKDRAPASVLGFSGNILSSLPGVLVSESEQNHRSESDMRKDRAPVCELPEGRHPTALNRSALPANYARIQAQITSLQAAFSSEEDQSNGFIVAASPRMGRSVSAPSKLLASAQIVEEHVYRPRRAGRINKKPLILAFKELIYGGAIPFEMKLNK